jgi:hypothetical protein
MNWRCSSDRLVNTGLLPNGEGNCPHGDDAQPE